MNEEKCWEAKNPEQMSSGQTTGNRILSSSTSKCLTVFSSTQNGETLTLIYLSEHEKAAVVNLSNTLLECVLHMGVMRGMGSEEPHGTVNLNLAVAY